ncbi:hypothetical protein PtB15_11B70 [Puccinia triticina]|nr:hypothetical protein PtB15_11B69 [Puccinia triticina]WAR59430.1 hypothetical protein PtB15_11B70 [Puccinia triticina]
MSAAPHSGHTDAKQSASTSRRHVYARTHELDGMHRPAPGATQERPPVDSQASHGHMYRALQNTLLTPFLGIPNVPTRRG